MAMGVAERPKVAFVSNWNTNYLVRIEWIFTRNLSSRATI